METKNNLLEENKTFFFKKIEKLGDERDKGDRK